MEVLKLSAKNPTYYKKALNALRKDGVVLISNLFNESLLSNLLINWKDCFSKPSISGTIGYCRTDYTKVMMSAFKLGKPAISIILNEKIITLTEEYLESKCILAETIAKIDKGVNYNYFPLHSDFTEGWSKTKETKSVVTKKVMKKPIGVGGVIYMHDTNDGAFSYSVGSHKIGSPYGQSLSNYPKKLRNSIENNVVICKGKKGDLILFDDRGFHGPNFPSKRDRSVILVDYYSVNVLGNTVVSPHPLWSTDLSNLSKLQTRVLGMNAGYMVEPKDYFMTNFKRNKLYNFVCYIIDKSYTLNHFKQIIKKIFFKINSLRGVE